LPPINVDISCDDIAILPFSSGTTGLSKAVMLTHRNLISNISMANHCCEGIFHHTTSNLDIIQQVIKYSYIFAKCNVQLNYAIEESNY